MKLIAEIEGQEGEYPIRLTYDGEWLTITPGTFEATRVSLDEFRKALDAVAPKAGPAPAPLTQMQNPHVLGVGINPYAPGIIASMTPTRAPDGTRIGPSPRESMRARPAPEANVVDPQEDAAA